MKYSLHLSLLIVLIFSFSFLNGQNWTNWRGPNFNGSSNTSESLPVNFDLKKGVKWKNELPGPSASTPIITDQHVFISLLFSLRD